MSAEFFGACGRTRTGDLLITSELLYQLSHTSASSADRGYYISFFPRRQLSFFGGAAEKNTIRIQAPDFADIFPFLCLFSPMLSHLSSKSQEKKLTFSALFRRQISVLPSPTNLHNIPRITILRFVIHIIHRVFHMRFSFIISGFFIILPISPSYMCIIFANKIVNITLFSSKNWHRLFFSLFLPLTSKNGERLKPLSAGKILCHYRAPRRPATRLMTTYSATSTAMLPTRIRYIWPLDT